MDYEAAGRDRVPPIDRSDRFQAERVAIISVGHAIHDTYTAFLAPLLSIFQDTMSLSNTAVGLLAAFLQWPSLLQPIIGRLADRFNLRYLVFLAPVLTAAMMSLLGVAPSYGLLALFLIVAGISSASIHAVGPVMAGNLSGKNLGRGMGFWMVGGELGRTLGPIAIVGAVGFLGLRGTPWLMLAGLLASAVIYLRLKDLPHQPASPSQGTSWWQIVRKMFPLLSPLAGIILVRAFTNAALTTYLPIFLKGEGAAFWFAGTSLTVLEAAGVVGALLGGTISDRLGRRWVIAASILTTTPLMLVFLAVQGWAQFPLLLAMGFTSLSVTPVIMALVQESFPENRALANGIYMSVSFIIRPLVAVVVGAMGDWFGLRLAFTACAIIPLLGLPVLLLLPGGRGVKRIV